MNWGQGKVTVTNSTFSSNLPNTTITGASFVTSTEAQALERKILSLEAELIVERIKGKNLEDKIATLMRAVFPNE
jgi:hypothetical protein